MAVTVIIVIFTSPIISAIASPPFLSNMFGRAVMAMYGYYITMQKP